MTIIDVMQEADSEYVIYFLLAAYIEAAQFAAKLPEYVKTLPIAGLGDVEMRYHQLMTALHNAVELSPDNACPDIQDALGVFDVALCRLAALERKRESSPAFIPAERSSGYEPGVEGTGCRFSPA